MRRREKRPPAHRTPEGKTLTFLKKHRWYYRRKIAAAFRQKKPKRHYTRHERPPTNQED